MFFILRSLNEARIFFLQGTYENCMLAILIARVSMTKFASL
jgi:hypothetical protein